MKKTLIQIAAISLMAMTLLACGKEDIKLPEVGESVTFTVQTDCGTKALGDHDGARANVDRCKVAVYMLTSDSSTPYKIYDKPEVNKHNNLSYSFTVNLLVQQTYQIVVWVDKAGLYDVNDELTSVTRVPGDVTCNSDAYDAFYASVPFVHGTDMVTAIVAKRPFAQLNLITQDLDPAAQPTKISLTYASPQSFNPLTATVGTEMTSVTYKADRPYYSSTEGTEHTLAMNYVFAAAETQTILPTVKLTALKGSTTVETQIANVPVQQNYRTNITGKLLTTSGTTSVNLTSTFEQ
ncbi:MAG: hypothetical protein PUK22_01750 [Bacteroides sp.]|nr:hypothetical protein [Bacteroides sp.]